MTWEMGHRWGMSIIHQYVINGISAFTWQTKGDSRSKLFRVQYLGRYVTMQSAPQRIEQCLFHFINKTTLFNSSLGGKTWSFF